MNQPTSLLLPAVIALASSMQPRMQVSQGIGGAAPAPGASKRRAKRKAQKFARRKQR